MASIFSRFDPHVQRVSGWLTVAGAVLSVIYTVIAKAAPLFKNLNWAGATLVGIALALATMLAVAVILLIVGYALRFFARPASSPTGNLPVLDFTETDRLRGEIQNLSEQVDKARTSIEAITNFHASTNKSVLEMIGELNSRTSSLSESLWNALAEHKEHMSDCYSTQDRARMDLASQFAALREKVANWEAQFDRETNAIREVVENHISAIRCSFAALGYRERLNELSGKVRQVAADMERRVQEGEKHDRNSWDSWDNNHSHWASLMAEWWSIARFYVAAPSKVFNVSDRQYRATEIPEHLFLDGEAMRVFRQFRVIQSQWDQTQESLQQNVDLVAFSGMTEPVVRNGAPVEQTTPKIR